MTEQRIQIVYEYRRYPLLPGKGCVEPPAPNLITKRIDGGFITAPSPWVAVSMTTRTFEGVEELIVLWRGEVQDGAIR